MPIRTSTAPTGPRSPPSPSNKFYTNHPPPASAAQADNKFNKILLNAARTIIPAGYRKDFGPPLTLEILRMISDRDSRRAKDPADPAIPALNAEIEHLIRDTARSRWISTISSPSYIRQAPANSGLVFMKENKC